MRWIGGRRSGVWHCGVSIGSGEVLVSRMITEVR